MKKGFTLMELLVVILIISVVSTSSVIMFGNINDDAKKIERENLYKNIQRSALMYLDLNEDWTKQFVKDGEIYISINELKGLNYVNVDTKDPVTKKEIPSNYFVKLYLDDYENPKSVGSCILEPNGEHPKCIAESDGKKTYDCTYCFTKNLPSNNVVEPVPVVPAVKPDELDCKYKETSKLKKGDEITFGDYTYRYKESYVGSIIFFDLYEDLEKDGWSVILTNKMSEAPVTSKICRSINGRPVTSMKNLFNGSNASSINLTNIDTSKVTDMSYMFSNLPNVKSLNLSNIDTRQVKYMGNMFSNIINIDELNLNYSKFSTLNVKDMSYMFNNNSASSIKLGSSFKTTNVEDMSGMYMGTNLSNSIDLSRFDTSKVKNMYRMFMNSSFNKITLKNNENNNLVDVREMFDSCKAEKIDLSKFYIKNAQYSSNMFRNLTNVTVYVNSNNEGTCRSSGEVGDGVIFTYK